MNGEAVQAEDRRREEEVTIPDRVKVGGVTYAIKHEPRINHECDVGGVCDHCTCEIVIQSTEVYAQDYREHILLHEVFHALLRHLSLENKIVDGAEEDVVDALAKGLQMLIKDNPDMFKEAQ